MAYYRFNPSGLTLDSVLERLQVLNAHLKTWGVSIRGIKMTAQVVWVETNIDIPNQKFQNLAAECGFPCTRTTNEPTTAP
jgi:hypothetical protein